MEKDTANLFLLAGGAFLIYLLYQRQNQGLQYGYGALPGVVNTPIGTLTVNPAMRMQMTPNYSPTAFYAGRAVNDAVRAIQMQ